MLIEFLKRQKSTIRAHRTNAKGKKIKGRYLIIESDDWGAIRTPSKAALESFEKSGIGLAESIYKNDSLECNEDLEELFNVLSSIKDKDGSNLKFTANAIMANPDFPKIKAADFKQFYFEDVQKT